MARQSLSNYSDQLYLLRVIIYPFEQKRNRRSCEKSCQETAGCNYWVYVSRKERDSRIAGACYLKENKVSVRNNVKKRTSGPRNCNGNSNGGNGNSNGGDNGMFKICQLELSKN